MSRRIEMIILGALLLVLAGAAYRYYGPTGDAPVAVSVDERFSPVDVDNPALRTDILKRFLALQYNGVHRNIFSASLPPPPAPPASKAPPVTAPPIPTGPPPLTVDARYFGYVSDMSGNHRKAFFASPNNEDVYIVGEGDTLMGRFRIVRLTSSTAEVEEVSSGRRATLTLEEPGPNG